MSERDPDDGLDWIEPVVSLAGLVGFNRVRVRWKLIRLRDQLRNAGAAATTRAAHVRYRHRSCPECGALNDGESRTCVRCGARMGSRSWTVLGRLGLSVPDVVSVSSVLCLLMVVIYLRMAVSGDGATLWGFSAETLVRFGGRWAPAIRSGEIWRLATPIFLHAGLWHIGFNVIALWQIGPALEELYGRGRMLLLFLLTGVLANVIGGLTSPAVGIGASGAIMGLIGLAAGWGHRDGTTTGREVRGRMIKWAVYVMLFGLFIGADNIAHAVGFATGAVLGYAIPVRRRRAGPPRPLDVAAGLLGGAATLACAVLILSAG